MQSRPVILQKQVEYRCTEGSESPQEEQSALSLTEKSLSVVSNPVFFFIDFIYEYGRAVS